MAQKKKSPSNEGGVGIKDRQKEKKKVQKPRKYKCVMYNDDYTPMDFVVAILQVVFNKSGTDAVKLMLDVHNKGRGIAGVYSKEIAETKSQRAKQIARVEGHPFTVEIEPE